MNEDMLNSESHDIFKSNPETIWEIVYEAQGQPVTIMAKRVDNIEDVIVFFGFYKNKTIEMKEFKLRESEILEITPIKVESSVFNALNKTFINHRKCKTLSEEMNRIRNEVNRRLKELGDIIDAYTIRELQRESAKAENFRKTIRLLEIENQLLSKAFMVA